MSDMLIAPDDDLFWHTTERTEAESPDVASKADAWIFTFLGSRVRSFRPAPDRVIVWYAVPSAVDAFTLPARLRGVTSLYSSCRALPRSWEPSPIAFFSFAEADSPWTDVGSVQGSNPVAELEADDAEPDAFQPRPDVDHAVSTIKELLGLTDEQLEAATGVSRSTLWRLRTGRTSVTRSVTEAPIWRLHNLASAMVDHVGIEGARSWLHAGNPSPAGLLGEGQLALVERAADQVLFPDPVTSRSAGAVAEDDYSAVMPRSAHAAVPQNRPRRVRRPGYRSR